MRYSQKVAGDRAVCSGELPTTDLIRNGEDGETLTDLSSASFLCLFLPGPSLPTMLFLFFLINTQFSFGRQPAVIHILCVNAWCQVTCQAVLLLPPPRCPPTCPPCAPYCLAPVRGVWAVCLLVWTWVVVTSLAFQGCPPPPCPHPTARRIPETLQMPLPHAALWGAEPGSHASSAHISRCLSALWISGSQSGGSQKALSQGSPRTTGKHRCLQFITVSKLQL